MVSARARCVVILSSRSSGSSALQNVLATSPGVHHIERTPHFQHETLFWCRAASVLGRPQVRMADSRLPFPPGEAREGLRALLCDNIGPDYVPPDSDEALVFDGWRALCLRYAPVFVEKSPHHLHQWGALELLLESLERVPEVETLFVGLVRNPIDTLYSMWRSWHGLPWHNQRDWYVAYTNLLRLRDLAGDRLVIVRYEEMVRDLACLAPVYRFIGQPVPRAGYLHREALGKWRQDVTFRFRLAPAVADLAAQFGYKPHEIANRTSRLWPFYAYVARWYARRLGPRLGRARSLVARNVRDSE